MQPNKQILRNSKKSASSLLGFLFQWDISWTCYGYYHKKYKTQDKGTNDKLKLTDGHGLNVTHWEWRDVLGCLQNLLLSDHIKSFYPFTTIQYNICLTLFGVCLEHCVGMCYHKGCVHCDSVNQTYTYLYIVGIY